MNEEQTRLAEAREKTAHWYRWGPYLSERQWGTVREDYSPDGDAWNYLTFDDAVRFCELQAQRFPGERFAVFSFTGCTRMIER